MDNNLMEKITHLKNFLLNIKSMVDNPYVKDIQVEGLVNDLCNYVIDLEENALQVLTTEKPSEDEYKAFII